MNLNLQNIFFVGTIFFVGSLGTGGVIFAQAGGGGGQGGDGFPTAPPTTQPTVNPTLPNSGQTGTGTGTGGNQTLDNTVDLMENQVQLGQDISIEDIDIGEDLRREIPFVGPNSGLLFLPFDGVGSITGGSTGGGFGNQFGGGFGNQLGGGFGNQFGQFGQQNGFEVQRRGIRASLRAAFTAPAITGVQRSTRFAQRLIRIPSIQRLGGTQNVQISVNDQGTAILSGFVNSAEAKDKVERMAKLEPGIYKIENRLQIRQ